MSSNSIITLKQNRYSIPSCFIGSRVDIRIYADEVQLWHANKHHLTMPGLIGKNQDFIDFRHVIDTLVRKPGAFENYRYREHKFPTLDFRKSVITHMLRGTAKTEKLLTDVWKTYHLEAVQIYRTEKRQEKASVALEQSAKRRAGSQLRKSMKG